LDARGDSVVVVGGEGLWNVHVHTDDAGPAVEAGVAVGRVFRIRITRLSRDADPREHDHDRDQVGDQQASREQTRSIVAVVPGSGAASLFVASGARVVAASAGSRPTPQMLVDAAADASDVVVLPNDDDHEAVAQSAALELRTVGRRVAIIPTHSVVQGVAAVAVHDPARSFTDDVVAMTAAAGATRHGGVTRAEREAMTSAGICHPGEILGLVEGDIALIGPDPLSVACDLVDRMLSAGGEIVTLVWGSDPFDGRELADGVREHLHRARRDVEVTIYDGGQQHYPLLIGVE